MTTSHRVVAALALLVAASVLALPFAGARPANEIPVYEPTEDVDLGTPTAEAWLNAPSVTVPLTSAPSGVPAADQTSVERIAVRAAVDDGRLYVRLAWADGTADDSTDAPRAFADAVAVQVPVNTSERPPIAMGGTRSRVNVWYWSGSTGTEELLAGGPGTTTRYDQPAVTATATREDGRWLVVFARDLDATGANRTTVTQDRNLDVAFAAWNGSQAERSGRKAVSEWHYFATGPGPAGPPYAALLWSVAGLAIVVAVLVTAHAVYSQRRERTGGEAGG